jgi:hypothetical protein
MTVPGEVPLAPLDRYIAINASIIAPDVPPISADSLQRRLVHAVRTHITNYRNLTQRGRYRVVRRAAIRFAHEFRTERYETTDQYFYWPQEVAMLLDIASEDYATRAAKHLLERYRDWNITPSDEEMVAATVGPHYLYSSFNVNLLDGLADVTGAIRYLPEDDRRVLEARYLFRYHPGDDLLVLPGTVKAAVGRLCRMLNAHEQSAYANPSLNLHDPPEE